MLWNRGIDFPDIRFGNAHKFGEAAIGVDAKNFYVRANMRLPDATCSAMATGHVHFRAYEIAGFDGGYLLADFLHDAAEFVAKRERRMNARRRPAIPVINVQIGAADRSSTDAN